MVMQFGSSNFRKIVSWFNYGMCLL